MRPLLRNRTLSFQKEETEDIRHRLGFNPDLTLFHFTP